MKLFYCFMSVVLFTFAVFAQVEFEQTSLMLEGGCYEKTLVYNDYLFAYSHNKLEIYYLSDNPIGPPLVNSMSFNEYDETLDIIASGDKLFVSKEKNRIIEQYNIEELLTAEDPQPSSSMLHGRDYFLGVSENYLISFFPQGDNELTFYDIETMEILGEYSDTSSPFKLSTSNGGFIDMRENLLWYCYEADSGMRTRILNVEDFGNIYEVADKPFDELRLNTYYDIVYTERNDTRYAFVPNDHLYNIYRFDLDGVSLVSQIISCVGNDFAKGGVLNETTFIHYLEDEESIAYHDISVIEEPTFLCKQYLPETISYSNNYEINSRMGLFEGILYKNIGALGIEVIDLSNPDDIYCINRICGFEPMREYHAFVGNYSFFMPVLPVESDYTQFTTTCPAIDLNDIDNPEYFEMPLSGNIRGNILESGDCLIDLAYQQSDVYDCNYAGDIPQYLFTVSGKMFYFDSIESNGYFLENENVLAKYNIDGAGKELLYSIEIDTNNESVYVTGIIKNGDLLLCRLLNDVYIITDNGSSFELASTICSEETVGEIVILDEEHIVLRYDCGVGTYQFVKYDISNPTQPEILQENYYSNLVTGILNVEYSSGYYAIALTSMPVQLLDENFDVIGEITDKPYETIRFYDDSHFIAKNDYEFAIYEFSVNSITNELSVAQKQSIPIMNNFPNPFNPSTRIDLDIGKDYTDARLNIYNSKGQLIKSYNNISLNKGEASIVWDGANFAGEQAASGVYFYQVVADDKPLDTKKMIMVK